MPQQESGCPSRVPHNIPPSSTSGKSSPQPGSITRASPKNPLKNVTNYRSSGWKKDLGHILRSSFHYNYPSSKEEEWIKLRSKFLKYLGQNYQGRKATPVYALHGEPLPDPHQPQTRGIGSIYRVDQVR